MVSMFSQEFFLRVSATSRKNLKNVKLPKSKTNQDKHFYKIKILKIFINVHTKLYKINNCQDMNFVVNC